MKEESAIMYRREERKEEKKINKMRREKKEGHIVQLKRDHDSATTKWGNINFLGIGRKSWSSTQRTRNEEKMT